VRISIVIVTLPRLRLCVTSKTAVCVIM